MKKGQIRTHTQVAHITMTPEIRERLEQSAAVSYRTLNMQAQYLMACSLTREPVLPAAEDKSRLRVPEGGLTRLPLRFDKGLYELITEAASARSASIALEIRTRLELAMNFEETRARNWSALENQINAVLQSNSLSAAQQEGLSEALALCSTDSMNDKRPPISNEPNWAFESMRYGRN